MYPPDTAIHHFFLCSFLAHKIYYTEFATDSLVLAGTLGHYMHILYLHGLSVTLLDAVCCIPFYRTCINGLSGSVYAHAHSI